MKKFTKEESATLKSLGVGEEETFNAYGYSVAERKIAAKELNARIIYGITPHKNCGFCLKTISGTCVVCNPSALGHQDRYRMRGYVYIAYSSSTGYIKFGSTSNISNRQKTLREQNYGGLNDWVIPQFMEVKKDRGLIEDKLKEAFNSKKVFGLHYLKDGKPQLANEIFKETVDSARFVLRKLVTDLS